MKKKKGFIATSLIYSFFLVFIAIMVALISNYVANKTILDRFNENIEDKKNKDTYSFKLVSKGSENFRIAYETNEEGQTVEVVHVKGQTLTNLIQDSNFTNSDYRWISEGSIPFFPNSTYNGKSGILLRNSASNSSIQQKNIMSIPDNKYYLSLEYASNYPSLLQAQLANTNIDYLNLQSNNLDWQRVGLTFKEGRVGTGEARNPNNIFYIKDTGITDGKYDPNLSKEAYLTNAILINLTAHYDPGREPEVDWLNENIDYFDGTVNYLVDNFIERGEEIIIKMISVQPNFGRIKTVNCRGVNGHWLSAGNIIYNNPTYDSELKKYVENLTLKNISDDIKCEVEWGE